MKTHFCGFVSAWRDLIFELPWTSKLGEGISHVLVLPHLRWTLSRSHFSRPRNLVVTFPLRRNWSYAVTWTLSFAAIRIRSSDKISTMIVNTWIGSYFPVLGSSWTRWLPTIYCGRVRRAD